MELLGLINDGQPILILGLIIMVDRLRTQVTKLSTDVDGIKKKITWGDTCNERHDEIDRRLGVLERSTGMNGVEKQA